MSLWRRCIPRPPFSVIARCHCTQCRKASGAEFATNATVARKPSPFMRTMRFTGLQDTRRQA
ncbi:MAG: GFA family protein [bacterium]